MAPVVRHGGTSGLIPLRDTIFAVASGVPPAAIAIIRISGPAAGAAVVALAGRCPAPRRASLRKLADPATGMVLDEAMVLWFPGPSSATGEDCAELHVHGGRAVQTAVLGALGRVTGCRPAQPGEFTRRAHANGRIDILQAEGLADLLAADTEEQRRTALAVADGALSREVAAWQESLTVLAAELEMAIDYADDDQADAVAVPPLRSKLEALAREWRTRLEGPSSETIRDGFMVALAGPPNAGKSTLFNRLVGHDAAIVTDIAGTTRDRIEARVVRGGHVYRLVDTAGLRDGDIDAVEAIGIERAKQAMVAAQLVLWLGDVPGPQLPSLWLWPKADRPDRIAHPRGAMPISAHDGRGIDGLWAYIDRSRGAAWPAPGGLAERHQMELAAALEAVSPCPTDRVLLAEAIRAARGALGRIAGGGGVEELFDTIFGRFCLGK